VATDNQENNGNASPLSLSQRGLTRRRLAKAGIGVVGVLSTLESRAAMSPMICKSPSGALSGGLSSNYNNAATTCEGLSPGYWLNHTSAWPVSNQIMFSAVFDVPGDKSSCTPQSLNQSYECSTMLNLLNPQDFDRYNLGRHVVATYLNIMSGKISFLSVTTLQKMWSDVLRTGQYSPASGVYWSAEQVKNYLENTHD
jgi:hypothetical protein